MALLEEMEQANLREAFAELMQGLEERSQACYEPGVCSGAGVEEAQFADVLKIKGVPHGGDGMAYDAFHDAVESFQ